MAFQPVPDTAACIINTSGLTFAWSNGLHFTRPDFTYQDMSDLADMFRNTWVLEHASALNAAYQIGNVTAYDLRSDGAPIYVTSEAPDVGTHVGSPIPIQNALVVTLRTGYRGRSGRGRLYMAGYDEAQITDGIFSAAIETDAVSLVAALHQGAQAIGWQMVIVQRFKDGVKLPQGVTHAVTSWQVRSRIPGNQDRRSQRP